MCRNLELTNKAKGIEDFHDSVATVYYDGTVHWQRGGFVVVMCTFVGLRKMPFDEIGCQLHMAGDQKRVWYNLVDIGDGEDIRKGFDFGGYAQSYTEYSPVRERMNSDYYDGDEGINGFHVDLFFKRSSRHYLQFTLFPNILFVILSFGQFFLEIDSGERLSFGVTILLIMVTQSIVVSSLLPLCQETLWINNMNFYSMLFAVLSLMSTLVGLGIRWVGDIIVKTMVKGENTKKNGFEEHDPTAFSPGEGKDHDLSIGPEDDGNDNDHQQANGQHDERKSRTLSSIVLLVDKIFFFLLPVGYVIFLIVMFTTLRNYDDEKDSDGKYIVWLY